eukprot:gnl/TRDRNA2_/TRDRNA2_132092_c0_seq6.p1 gnl/TRDRNA2_/TRDRNA2_132092_c0~~gnl/TRDRNA2_/TRDRNA2_132092_c0_seq6.p1  ORF type:complete len:316 (-),score=41.82 gnl/TRDRNA2_/TRDRNA2_132092_c0_seq6:485-1432(-)
MAMLGSIMCAISLILLPSLASAWDWLAELQEKFVDHNWARSMRAAPQRAAELRKEGLASGGLLLPYYVGVAYELQDLGLLTSSTPHGDTSVGALKAGMLAFGVPEEVSRASMKRFAERVRNGEYRWPLVKCRDTIGIMATVRKSSFENPDVIQPGQPGTKLPDDTKISEWGWKFSAPPSDDLKMLFLGREHAKTWAINNLEQQYALPARVSLHLPGMGTNSKNGLAPPERSAGIPTKDRVAALQRSQAQSVRAELPQGWRSLQKWPLMPRTHPMRISRFVAHTTLHAVSIPTALLVCLLTFVVVTFVGLRSRPDI